MRTEAVNVTQIVVIKIRFRIFEAAALARIMSPRKIKNFIHYGFRKCECSPTLRQETVNMKELNKTKSKEKNM